MKLQSKLLMPVLIGVAILTVIVHFYWGPSLLKDKRQLLLDQHSEVLDILAQGLVPSLLSGDLATLHATLDQQMVTHKKNWLSLHVHNSEQQRLYPLFPSETPEGKYLLSIKQQIIWNGDSLGELSLIVDSRSEIEKELDRIQQLEWVSMLIFFLISIISLLWQKLFILRPIQQLQQAAEHLGKGNYGHPLTVRGNDEVANLTRVFETMRNHLLKTNQELQEAAFQARESEYRQRTVLENIADGILTTDQSGTIISANPAATEIFSLPHQQLIGMELLSLLNSKKDISTSLTDGDSISDVGSRIEVESEKPDGSALILEMAYNSLELDGLQLFTVIVRDITESKRIERMKSEFVSTVSHELRTPLTSIRGSLGLVVAGVAGEIPDKAMNLLQLASNNVERLGVLINDLLDMQKIESGELEFNLSRQSLAQLLGKAINDNEGFAQQHQVALKLQLLVEDSTVMMDETRFAQVMSNLLSNAIKFSDNGSTVKVVLESQKEQLVVSVIDQGVGIPAEFHQKLFDKFTQHDASDTRSVGGTGLGLSISKSLVERLNGELDFVSREGKGTTFTIRFPRG